MSVAFSRLCRKLEIENFHFHDLRHTAASWLRMKGADIHTVAQLLGHKGSLILSWVNNSCAEGITDFGVAMWQQSTCGGRSTATRA